MVIKRNLFLPPSEYKLCRIFLGWLFSTLKLGRSLLLFTKCRTVNLARPVFYMVLNNTGNSGFLLALHKITLLFWNILSSLKCIWWLKHSQELSAVDHRRKAHLPISFTAPSKAALHKRYFVIPCPSYQADSPAVGGQRHISFHGVQGQRQFYMDGRHGQFPVSLTEHRLQILIAECHFGNYTQSVIHLLS